MVEHDEKTKSFYLLEDGYKAFICYDVQNGEFDVLITTYEIALVEATRLSSISWTGIVVDEAHRLKGKNNKLGDVLRKIDFGCKLLLTGTPLQVRLIS